MVMASVALWLGVYSTVVSTVVALLTLYAEVFLRVRVMARPGWFGSDQGPAFREHAEAFPQTGQVPEPALGVYVCNRGRQSVWVERVYQARSFAPHRALQWAPYVNPEYVPPNTTLRFPVLSADKGSLRRVFVVDGVGLIHPLRQRWRIHLEDWTFRCLWLRLHRTSVADDAN
jgi:hypothetical protein